MPNYKVNTIDIEKAQRKLSLISRDVKDLKLPMKKISIYLDSWVQSNFKTQGGKVGGWDRLRGGGRRIKGGGFDPQARVLQDTGRLKASFLPFHSKDNAGIGSELPYSKGHNEGINGMKKRRMIPDKSDVDVQAKATKIYVKHVNDAFKKHEGKNG